MTHKAWALSRKCALCRQAAEASALVIKSGDQKSLKKLLPKTSQTKFAVATVVHGQKAIDKAKTNIASTRANKTTLSEYLMYQHRKTNATQNRYSGFIDEDQCYDGYHY